jgi:hypothetical protein
MLRQLTSRAVDHAFCVGSAMSEHACQSMFWFASGLVVTEAQREKVGEGRGDLRVRGFLAVLGMTGLRRVGSRVRARQSQALHSTLNLCTLLKKPIPQTGN